jgi:linoleoyl-CoA desaturase
VVNLYLKYNYKMKIPVVKFAKDHNEQFYITLKQRVADYFKTSNVARHGNMSMVFKTIFMISLYVVPYLLMLMYFENPLLIVLMWVLMGFGMAGIGLSIMHDANHGAYSKNQTVNKVLSYIITLVGGHDVNWRIQHNVLHHTYTNVTGLDEDLNPGSTLRFCPHEPRLPAHKYQHFYAWFLYGMMTLLWSTTKDFKQLFRYRKLELLETQNVNFVSSLMILIVSKILYYIVVLILPIMYCANGNFPILGTIGSYLLMHFICGVILGAIFQPAHIVPTSDFPLPDASGNIDADWAVSQLCNTSNFAPGARLFSWYVGGLNYQVEHHLFPNICHVHYRKISAIVEATAKEYNLPYYSLKTWGNAISLHNKMLYNLGHYDDAKAMH